MPAIVELTEERVVMPSFDIVSEIDMQEVRNAVNNANKALESRYDFRNVTASIEMNEKIRPSKLRPSQISRLSS